MAALCGSNDYGSRRVADLSVKLWFNQIAMNKKIEFVKETKPDGEVCYYTQKDGWYVADSLRFDKAEARAIFMRILETPEAKPVKEVLESIELTNL